MTAIFKIGFYDPCTGTWVEGEKEMQVSGWCDMMDTKIRWKKALAARYNGDVEVECKEKNTDEETINEIFRSYKSPFISSWAPGEPLSSLEEEEDPATYEFEPGRVYWDEMAANP